MNEGPPPAVEVADSGDPTARTPRDPQDRPDESGARGSSLRDRAWSGTIPWFLLAALGVFSLVRNGVELSEVVRFGLFWAVTLLAPGYMLFRSFGRLDSVQENLFGAAATGLALEIAAWHLFRAVGLDSLVGWWWVPVVVVFAAVPPLRARWLRSHREVLPGWWNWAMVFVTGSALVAVDVGGFRPNPLPPSDGNVYVDMWWHLALVQELMRDAPAQVPQVAGEALDYHFNAHVHVAVAAESAGISPEVVLFRLWYVPIVVVTLGLVAVAARRLAGADWAGPVAAWLTVGVLAGGFIWPVSLGVLGGSPIVVLSPSQMIANVFMVAAIALLVDIVRGRATRRHVAMLLVTAWVGSGAKPTVAALLLAGVAAAVAASVLIRRTRPNWATVVSGLGLAVVLVASLASQSSAASRTTVLGSLRGNRVYAALTPDTGLRGVNDGWLLDSVNSGRAVVAVVAALTVLLGSQAVRLIGFGVLVRRETRRDPTGWFLAGIVVAGWLAFLVLDHVGYSQAYFVHTAVPAASLMAAWLLVGAVGNHSLREVAPVVIAGTGVGAVTYLLSSGAAARALELPSAGMLEVVTIPILIVGTVAVACWFAWTRLGAVHAIAPLGLLFAIALTLGAASAPALSTIAGRLVDFVRSPAPALDVAEAGFVTEGELSAARWLRDNSDEEDVIVTNLHCRPPSNEPIYCDARGYWLGGQSGRRIVLEGWAYTSEAQEMHGEGGRSFALQPAPWPERYELSQSAVVAPTAEILDRLSSEFGASWVVAVRRADPVSPQLGELADLAYDNGEVAIYRLR